MKLFFQNPILLATLLLVALVFSPNLQFASAAIGVNYGLLGSHLPAPADVIKLYKRENISLLRIFEPRHDVLDALRRSGLKVSLGVRNEDIPSIAGNVNAAINWVNNNVVPYARDVRFGWITLGNEMVPGPNAGLLPQAMRNILSALNTARLTGIKVSTVVNSAVLGVSYPPSAGDFTSEASGPMQGIINFITSTNNPILINVYPYFAYESDPTHVPLGYALFSPDKPVIDGNFKYYSLFEAMVDAFVAALEKHGGSNVPVVVSETGWPTNGHHPYSGIDKAQTYNQKLINKMKSTGTPRRPSAIMDILIFAMFNEDEKPPGIEQNWGFHYPNMEYVYRLTF